MTVTLLQVPWGPKLWSIVAFLGLFPTLTGHITALNRSEEWPSFWLHQSMYNDLFYKSMKILFWARCPGKTLLVTNLELSLFESGTCIFMFCAFTRRRPPSSQSCTGWAPWCSAGGWYWVNLPNAAIGGHPLQQHLAHAGQDEPSPQLEWAPCLLSALHLVHFAAAWA